MALSDIDTGIRASLYCLEHGTRRQATDEITKLQRKLRENLLSYQLRLNEAQREVQRLRKELAARDAEAEAESVDMESEEDLSASEGEEEEEEEEEDEVVATVASEAEEETSTPSNTVTVSGVPLITEPVSDAEMDTGEEEDEEPQQVGKETGTEDSEAVRNSATGTVESSASESPLDGSKDRAAAKPGKVNSGASAAGILHDSAESEELDYESGEESDHSANKQSGPIEEPSSSSKQGNKTLQVDSVVSSPAVSGNKPDQTVTGDVKQQPLSKPTDGCVTKETVVSSEEGEILSHDEEEDKLATSSVVSSAASKPHKAPAKTAAAAMGPSTSSPSTSAAKSSSLASPSPESAQNLCGVTGHKAGCSCQSSSISAGAAGKKVSVSGDSKGSVKKGTPQKAKGVNSKTKAPPKPLTGAKKVPAGSEKAAQSSSSKQSPAPNSNTGSASGPSPSKKQLPSPSKKLPADKSSTKKTLRKPPAPSGSSQGTAGKSPVTGKTAPSGAKNQGGSGTAVTSSGTKSGVKSLSGDKKSAIASGDGSTAKNSPVDSNPTATKRPLSQLSKENGDLNDSPVGAGNDPNNIRKKRLKRQMYSDKEVADER